VRGIDGCQGGHIGCEVEFRDGVAAIQSAFGMGNDIDFFTTGAFRNELDAGGQLSGTFLYGKCRLVLAVEQSGTVKREGAGDSAPIVEQLAVTEEYAVNQDDGISGFAEFAKGRITGNGFFLDFELDFSGGNVDNLSQNDEVDHRDQAAQGTDGTPLEAHQHGGAVNADDSVPEQNGGCRNAVYGAPNPVHVGMGDGEKGEDDVPKDRWNQGKNEYGEERCAVIADSDSFFLRSLRTESREDVHDEK